MDVEIRFEAGAAIKGTLVDADGKPYTAAWVQVIGDDGMGQSGAVDTDGRFTVTGLKSGPQTLAVMARDAGRVMLSGVKVDAPSDDVRLVLPPQRKLSGRVVGPSQRGFMVYAYPAVAKEGETMQSGTAKVDAEGRFAMDVAGDGPFSLRAQSMEDDRFGRLEGVKPGVDAAIPLEDGGAIEGVVEEADGTPISGNGWVSARGDRWTAWSQTGKDGAFRLRGLPQGRYKLSAQSETGRQVAAEDVDAGTRGLRLRFK
jgi:hypothetical protein